jgi:anti-anti-sigma factor
MSSGLGAPTDFRVAINYTDVAVVLDISGELDGRSAPELNAVFDTMFDRGHDSVVLDLSGLVFMDGHGLQVITSAARRLRFLGDVLTLRSPSPEVQRILAVNGLAGAVRLELDNVEQSQLGPEQSSIDRNATVRSAPTTAIRRDPVLTMPVERQLLDDALGLVVKLAKMAVGGADGVSVSLLRDGHIKTVAASDQTILKMDASQYATREGPCLDASTEGRWFHVNSLENETRWPAFVPMARALGIHAILSNPLLTQTRPVGALNIYSRSVAAFGSADQELAAAFAAETSLVLSNAGLGESADGHSQRLHHALRSREIIAQAQGIVMERASVGEDAAFDHLRRFSQQSARPLRERAEDIVASTRWPEPVVEEITGDPHD